MAPALFLEILERALTYRVTQIETLERISVQLMKKGLYEEPTIPISNDYANREAYQAGQFSDEPDLRPYQDLLEGKEEER